jgi:hypothetical protein
MNLREPAGARTDLRRAREHTHHALYHLIPLRVLCWSCVAIQTTVRHGGSA